jgi:hypothetical protein
VEGQVENGEFVFQLPGDEIARLIFGMQILGLASNAKAAVETLSIDGLCTEWT